MIVTNGNLYIEQLESRLESKMFDESFQIEDESDNSCENSGISIGPSLGIGFISNLNIVLLKICDKKILMINIKHNFK